MCQSSLCSHQLDRNPQSVVLCTLRRCELDCEEAYVNLTTCSTLFRGETINMDQEPGPKDPRTGDRGPKDQGPEDLAVFYSAFMTEMQLQATCVNVSKFKLTTVSL